MRPGILINNVSLKLQSHIVFDGLSLNLEGGQCHCILGRSGVEKSSLLNIISGAVEPQSGSVNCSNGLALYSQVAYMFQDDGLLPWLSILDNVQLGPRLRGEAGCDSHERAIELLSAVGLAEWAPNYPERLSGGMRRRVTLARTLLEDRPIILMDEPFSRLDAITRDEVQVLASTLLHNRTVVLVTHDPSEALRIGHTVTVLQPSLPSKATTFAFVTTPPRVRHDAEAVALTPSLWSALAGDTSHTGDSK